MPVLVLYPDAKEIPMEDKKLFLIGEVAKMFHISMGTLRHYEQAGLLTPEYTDPDTGYRYYGTRQFELLNTIRYLRVLDFPLARFRRNGWLRRSVWEKFPFLRHIGLPDPEEERSGRNPEKIFGKAVLWRSRFRSFP